MSVYDLLLEQATEEQVLVARRHMAMPLDLLERCYPVWVAEPTAEEQKRMPARARDFYARFDGKTSLGEAFSGDARLRGREMDLLLLQLQKGRLALLPGDAREARGGRRRPQRAGAQALVAAGVRGAGGVGTSLPFAYRAVCQGCLAIPSSWSPRIPEDIIKSKCRDVLRH